MYVVDAHQDIAFNYVCFGRDYRRSALRKRQLEAGGSVPTYAGNAVLGLPEAMVGRVALVFATLFVSPRPGTGGAWENVYYKDAAAAYRLAMMQMDYYQRLTDEDDRLVLVREAADLDKVLATWTDDTPITERVQGLVILMEGADPIIEPKQFEEWAERGVRLVGPAWSATRYSGGTGAPGPLTALGHELLEVMAGFNTVLDLSHMAEQAFFQALDAYEGSSIIASHSNPRKHADTDRHLSDTMIQRLAERDGVIGVVMWNPFLRGGWTRSDGKRAVTLTTLVDAVDHICQLTGSAQHVGLGSDFDGGFGVESIPLEFDTVADLWRVKEALEGRGFSPEDVAAVLGGNMTRKLRESLSG